VGGSLEDGKTFHAICTIGAQTAECTQITALGVKGGGVIVRTKTTTQKTVAEALAYLPGARLTEDNNCVVINNG